MLILLTQPEPVSGETEVLQRMLENHPGLVVHLRKPLMDFSDFEALLTAINPVFHPRIVIHQHHQLYERYALKGIHLTEAIREQGTGNREQETGNREQGTGSREQVVSTSFHSPEDARKSGSDYAYFFCAPVFDSISKPGYLAKESWDISAETEAFRSRAVALGGIDLQRQEELLSLGFLHAAVLGAVWQAENPEAALRELCAAFQH